MSDIRSVQPTHLAAPASFWKALHGWLHEQLAREVRLPPAILRAMPAKKNNKKKMKQEISDDDEDKESEDEDDDVKPGSWKRSHDKDKPWAPTRAGSVKIGSRGGDSSPEKVKLSLKAVQTNPLLLNLFRQRMGLARLRVGYSGFAPLPAKVMACFGKLGVTVCELYAHPYATGLVACNRPPPLTDASAAATKPEKSESEDSDSEEESEDEEAEQTNKPGTVGAVLAGAEVELDEGSVPQGKSPPPSHRSVQVQ